MKFGVGIITTGKRQLDSGYTSLLSQSTTLHVHFDYERRGPGHGRNECIHTLYEVGCDYIALFDDDCFPYTPDWQDYVVGNMQKHNLNHLQLWEYSEYRPNSKTELVSVPYTIGCFSVLTRKTVETVGYYSPQYSRYGWEDVGYTARVRKSGVNNTDKAISLKSLPKYIKSQDVEKRSDFDGFANMSKEEKDLSIKANSPVLVQEAAGPIYIAYQPGVGPHPPKVLKG